MDFSYFSCALLLVLKYLTFVRGSCNRELFFKIKAPKFYDRLLELTKNMSKSCKYLWQVYFQQK